MGLMVRGLVGTLEKRAADWLTICRGGTVICGVARGRTVEELVTPKPLGADPYWVAKGGPAKELVETLGEDPAN